MSARSQPDIDARGGMRGQRLNRRTTDAWRFLPILGVVLFAVPLLWSSANGSINASSALIYLFGTWFGLILICAVLARGKPTLRPRGRPDTQP